MNPISTLNLQPVGFAGRNAYAAGLSGNQAVCRLRALYREACRDGADTRSAARTEWDNAFAQFYEEKAKPLLKGLLAKYTHPRYRNLHEDIMQEAFISARRAFGEFRGNTDAQLANWMGTIALNTMRNASRREDRIQGALSWYFISRFEGKLRNGKPMREGVNLDGQQSGFDLSLVMDEALARMACEYPSDVLTLRTFYFQGKSVKEMAADAEYNASYIAGSSKKGLHPAQETTNVGSVKRRLHTARQRLIPYLHTVLEKEGVDVSAGIKQNLANLLDQEP